MTTVTKFPWVLCQPKSTPCPNPTKKTASHQHTLPDHATNKQTNKKRQRKKKNTANTPNSTTRQTQHHTRNIPTHKHEHWDNSLSNNTLHTTRREKPATAEMSQGQSQLASGAARSNRAMKLLMGGRSTSNNIGIGKPQLKTTHACGPDKHERASSPVARRQTQHQVGQASESAPSNRPQAH